MSIFTDEFFEKLAGPYDNSGTMHTIHGRYRPSADQKSSMAQAAQDWNNTHTGPRLAKPYGFTGSEYMPHSLAQAGREYDAPLDRSSYIRSRVNAMGPTPSQIARQQMQSGSVGPTYPMNMGTMDAAPPPRPVAQQRPSVSDQVHNRWDLSKTVYAPKPPAAPAPQVQAPKAPAPRTPQQVTQGILNDPARQRMFAQNAAGAQAPSASQYLGDRLRGSVQNIQQTQAQGMPQQPNLNQYFGDRLHAATQNIKQTQMATRFPQLAPSQMSPGAQAAQQRMFAENARPLQSQRRQSVYDNVFGPGNIHGSGASSANQSMAQANVFGPDAQPSTMAQQQPQQPQQPQAQPSGGNPFALRLSHGPNPSPWGPIGNPPMPSQTIHLDPPRPAAGGMSQPPAQGLAMNKNSSDHWLFQWAMNLKKKLTEKAGSMQLQGMTPQDVFMQQQMEQQMQQQAMQPPPADPMAGGMPPGMPPQGGMPPGMPPGAPPMAPGAVPPPPPGSGGGMPPAAPTEPLSPQSSTSMDRLGALVGNNQQAGQELDVEANLKTAGCNTYQTAFLLRCQQLGMTYAQTKQAVDYVHAKFGKEASAELYVGLEKTAGILDWGSRMAGWLGQGAKFFGKAEQAAGAAGKAMGAAGKAEQAAATAAKPGYFGRFFSGFKAPSPPPNSYGPHLPQSAPYWQGAKDQLNPMKIIGNIRQTPMGSFMGGMTGLQTSDPDASWGEMALRTGVGTYAGSSAQRFLRPAYRALSPKIQRPVVGGITGTMLGDTVDEASERAGINTHGGGKALGLLAGTGLNVPAVWKMLQSTGALSPTVAKGMRTTRDFVSGFGVPKGLSPGLSKTKSALLGAPLALGGFDTLRANSPTLQAVTGDPSALVQKAMNDPKTQQQIMNFADQVVTQATGGKLNLKTGIEMMNKGLATAETINSLGGVADQVLGMFGFSPETLQSMSAIQKWMMLLGGGSMLGGMLTGSGGMTTLGGLALAGGIMPQMGGMAQPPQAPPPAQGQPPGNALAQQQQAARQQPQQQAQV